MLQFFRRYQKSLLVFITILIIFSFVFSGVYSTFLTHGVKKPIYVAKTWNGDSIEKEQLQKWVHFISTEKDGDNLLHINLLNDGILVRDLFATGIFQKLFMKKKEEYQEHYEKIWDKIKNYQFYQHPHTPHLSAKAIWGSFNPEILESLKNLPDTFNEDAFVCLLRLYEAERSFPPQMLKKTLRYYEKQAGIPADSHLPSRNLGLFGFQSAEDWFPKKLLEEACLFLINAAQYAEKQGISFGPISVKQALYETISGQIDDPTADLQNLVNRQMQALGLHQKELFSIISSVRMGRIYRESLAESVWIEPSFLGNVLQNRLRLIKAIEHGMAPQFCFKTPLDYAYFSLYKMAVSPDTGKEIHRYFSPSAVKKQYPQFVYQDYDIEVSYTPTQECASHIPLKDIWAWQLEDASFRSILRKFPQLPGVTALTKEERRAALQSLERSMQRKILTFSKAQMVRDFPELITKQLSQKTPQRLSIKAFANGKVTGLEMMDTKRLYALLQQAPSKRQIDLTEKELRAKEELLLFPNDDEGFFRIEIVRRGEKETILTYLDAKNLGLLEELFQEQKEEMEPILRQTHPEIFGKDRTSEEQKIALAQTLFPCKDLAGYFAEFLEKEQKNPAISTYANTIEEQFFLQSSEKTLSTTPQTEELFSLTEGSISPLQRSGFPIFYTILRQEDVNPYEAEEYLALKKALNIEVEQKASESLLEQFTNQQLFLY